MARKPLCLRSIFLKFSISFIIIGLIPLLFFSFIAIDTFSKNIEEVTIQSQEQLLGYAGENIGKLIAGYNDLTKLVYTYNSDSYGEPLNNLLKRAAETHSKSISAIQSTLAINDFVRSLLYTDAYIQNVIFIDERMRAYDASQMSKVFNTDYDFYNKGRLKYIIQNRNQLTILPSHKAEYYKGSSELVISFARNFYDLSQIESHKILGTIQIDVDVNTFDTVFNHLTTQSEDEIYLVDNDGYCIYSNLREKIAKNMGWFQQKKTKFTNKNFTGYFLDEQVYYIYSKVPTQNWVIIRKIYQKDILNKVQGIRNFLKIIITVCSMGLILVAIVFSRRFSIPVQRMLRQMKKVERGDLNSRVTINSQDEMGQLAEGFNNMVCELQRYIAKSYLAQNKQKEAELNALKTQIQPHFLYNTLEVIRMSAVDHGDEQVAEMVHSLAAQLRYLIGCNDDLVTLGQELEMVENYFRLIRIRYEDKIDLEIRIPEQIRHYHILKLTLQPVVENAVVHGLKPKTSHGKVLITGEIAGGHLVLNVLDDGIGMTEATLAGINDLLVGEKIGEPTAGGWKNVGLKNVHDRLRLRFGEPYGIDLKSQALIGTVVRIITPIISDINNSGGVNHAQDGAG